MKVIVLISVIGYVVLSSIYNYSFNFHSVFLLSSASFSTGHSSLSGEATQTFVPEGSSPLLVLNGLGCYSFPLTLIAGNGNVNKHPKGSPVFQTYYHEKYWRKNIGQINSYIAGTKGCVNFLSNETTSVKAIAIGGVTWLN